MLMNRIVKYLVFCFVSLFISTTVYASCTPVLVLLRHAEDNMDGSGGLDQYGKAHAHAYAALFAGVKNKLDDLLGVEICPFKKFISLHTPNPQDTIAQTAKEAATSVTVDPGYHVPAPDKDSSTLIVLNRQTMWGDNASAPDSSSFLGKIAGKNEAMKNTITSARSPRFNYLYVFKTDDLKTTYNSVNVYLQLYNTNLKKNACIGRLKKADFQVGVEPSVVIHDIEKFSTAASDKCYWPDK